MADTSISFGISQCGAWGAGRTSEAAGSEPALLEGLREGADWAYEMLLSRYESSVYNLVYRLVDNPADTADVVQEVFLKVFRYAPTFRGDSSLKTWIYRIACNEAHNHHRWFHRRRGPEVGLDDEQSTGLTYDQALPDDSPSPFEIALDHEHQAVIEAALNSLKPQFRHAVVLCDLEGLSYQEIAEVTGISMGTVKSRILRGREALRKALTGKLDRPGSPTEALAS